MDNYRVTTVFLKEKRETFKTLLKLFSCISRIERCGKVFVQDSARHEGNDGKGAHRVLGHGGEERVDKALEELEVDAVYRGQTRQQAVRETFIGISLASIRF